MIGPDFNCTAMMVPVGDAVTNEVVLSDVQSTERKCTLPEEIASVQDGRRTKHLQAYVGYKVDAFVAVFDTTDGLIRSSLYCIPAFVQDPLTTDDLHRCACLQVLQGWRTPRGQALLNHFGT
jgi:hypothetical protein